MIKNILDEINLSNGTNDKMLVLEKYKNNKLFARVLKMSMDKVVFNYGVTMLNINIPSINKGTLSLELALDLIEKNLVTREITGNAAIELVQNLLSQVSKDSAYIIECILNRKLKINIGKTNINKVFKDLITRPPYSRCEIGTKANVEKNIDFSKKVYSQVKMDGTYRSALNSSGVTIMSRQGNEDSFPLVESQLVLLQVNDKVFLGEMTLRGEKDRNKGNGLINSDNPPHEDIVFTVWDMLPASEYAMTKDEIKVATAKGTLSHYEDRFSELEQLLIDTPLANVELVEYKIVTSMKEAYEHFQEISGRGDEGTIIKAADMVWKDGNSKQQLKVKLVISAEMRITGFKEMKEGSKLDKLRKKWKMAPDAKIIASILFENDDKDIQGATAGISEDLMFEITGEQDRWMSKIIEVEFNDITKSKSNDYYAFSHPRFIADRSDEKSTTDTLAKCEEMKIMAMENGGA